MGSNPSSSVTPAAASALHPPCRAGGSSDLKDIPIQLPEPYDPAASIALIDRAISAAGLLISLKGTLKSYPGTTHWHCKMPGKSGTLEVTYWPAKQRAWFKIQAARDAAWIQAVLPILTKSIEARAR